MNLTRRFTVGLAAACLTLAAHALVIAGPALAADDTQALRAELKRLSERLEVLEKHNQEMEKALASDRVSEKEPAMATRVKELESQTLAWQKQARRIEGIDIRASLTSVVQTASASATASGERERRANYRGDISVTLPGGEMGDTEGHLFTHLRFGQGNGVGLRPTYASTPNTTAFQVGSVAADDSFGILAQAWYQLRTPLLNGGPKGNARENLYFTFGKIDPFVFFDQNSAADDESAKFLNNVFVHNPLLDSGGEIAADAYGFAPGAVFQYTNEHKEGAEWGLSLGVFGTSGNRAANSANFGGNLRSPLVIMQAQTAARVNFLPGNYRVYLWRNGHAAGYDNVERQHAGIGVSVDQQITGQLTVFGRYGHQLKGKVRFDRALTLGAELGGGHWGRGADSLGFAAGAVRTSGKFRNDSPGIDADNDGIADVGYQASGTENQFELYYRYKVNSHFDLTPDIQWIRRPGGDGTAQAITVLGLRAKVEF
jgi:hypothetical protein